MNLQGEVKSINEVSYDVVIDPTGVNKGDTSWRHDSKNYIFHPVGNLISIKNYSSQGELWYNESFKYDKQWNKIEEIRYGADGDIEWIHTLNYDGNLTNGEILNSDGSLRRKYTKKQDGNGNEIEEIGYNAITRLNYKCLLLYDSQGNNIEYNLYHNDFLKYKFEYKYDSKGNVIEYFVYDKHGKVLTRQTYLYDYNNNLVESNWYKSDGSLEQKRNYSYEYDEKRNWVSRICYYNDVPKLIEERQIEYFGN